MSNQSLRTLDCRGAANSTMTAMAAHTRVPVLATGSHAQYINILGHDGQTLNIIKYHDGFLGQRIGPVSCLEFHPNAPVLATGALDSIVSIFSSSA